MTGKSNCFPLKKIENKSIENSDKFCSITLLEDKHDCFIVGKKHMAVFHDGTKRQNN